MSDAQPSVERFRLGRADLLLILGFWTFFAVLAAANRLVDPRGPGLEGGLASAPVALAFFESYLWAAITPIAFWMASRLTHERWSWLLRMAMLLGVGFVVAVAVDVAVDLFRIHAFDVPRWRARGVSVSRTVSRLWFLDDVMIYFAVVAAGFAREYFVRYRLRQEEAVRLHAQAGRLEAQLAEARLRALRMQLNPHFLFNTLHAVSSLVERDPRGVRRMIARLSDLLRHTLEDTGAQEIPLEREIEFLRRYLEIMEVRFQGRLDVDVRVPSDAQSALVPNLILQPLVENAVRHGVGGSTDAGRIGVHAHVESGMLHVVVRDNGPGLAGTEVDELEEGVGLRNVRERLRQLYGDEAGLSLSDAEGGGLAAEIVLPYHTRGDLRAAAAPPCTEGRER